MALFFLFPISRRDTRPHTRGNPCVSLQGFLVMSFNIFRLRSLGPLFAPSRSPYRIQLLVPTPLSTFFCSAAFLDWQFEVDPRGDFNTHRGLYLPLQSNIAYTQERFPFDFFLPPLLKPFFPAADQILGLRYVFFFDARVFVTPGSPASPPSPIPFPTRWSFFFLFLFPLASGLSFSDGVCF